MPQRPHPFESIYFGIQISCSTEAEFGWRGLWFPQFSRQSCSKKVIFVVLLRHVVLKSLKIESLEVTHIWIWTWMPTVKKYIQTLKQSFTILDTWKCSNSWTAAHQTCKLEPSSQKNSPQCWEPLCSTLKLSIKLSFRSIHNMQGNSLAEIWTTRDKGVFSGVLLSSRIFMWKSAYLVINSKIHLLYS